MAADRLYKYLDFDGGLAMLQNSNLQFTNATQLNDPFDCHPGLIDFSNVPDDNLSRVWGKDRIALLRSNPHDLLHDRAWICSLSKVNNSLLMWSYYCNHQGVCIGLDMVKTRKYLSRLLCGVHYGAQEIEVQYKEIIEKPDCFHPTSDLFCYQLGTKAKDWEHEQEVRLVLQEPNRGFIPSALPRKLKNRKEVIDYKEIRFYPHIGCECFESIYLGIKIDAEKKIRIINFAKNLNPDIIVYQMETDPVAVRLVPKAI